MRTSLLAVIGHDCVGALQFLREIPNPPRRHDRCRPVSEREIYKHSRHPSATAPLGITEDESFRISLIAGAQEKSQPSSVGTIAGTSHAAQPPPPHLQTLHREAPQRCGPYCQRRERISMLEDSKKNPSGRNADMKTFGDRRVLIVERFDRLWTNLAREKDRNRFLPATIPQIKVATE